MRGKGDFPKSLIWAGAVGIGAMGGLLLGNFVVGHEVAAGSKFGSYAEATGNPDALGVSSSFGEPCYDCGRGYGAAMPQMAANDARMDHAFRELGAVRIDYASGNDDYAYGGRFDDPAAARTIVMQSPVPVEVAAPATDTPPPVIATLAVAPASEPAPGPPDAIVD